MGLLISLLIKLKKNNKPYVFVIDEINRGEMSKIMGELFFSIDPGYRGTKGRVRTQYANMLKEVTAEESAENMGLTEEAKERMSF